MKCKWCDEEMTKRDFPPADGPYMHYECAARAVIGSVGHIEGRCTCYGGTEEDPPGLTRREAAKAALGAFRYKQRSRGDEEGR